jgi:acetylornithine aminotransferase
VDNARQVGNYLMEQLKALQAVQPHIIDVRGRGLMIGVQLDMPYKEVRQRLVYDHHCFVGCSGSDTLRLLPPLCLTKAEADQFIEKLKQVLS